MNIVLRKLIAILMLIISLIVLTSCEPQRKPAVHLAPPSKDVLKADITNKLVGTIGNESANLSPTIN